MGHDHDRCRLKRVTGTDEAPRRRTLTLRTKGPASEPGPDGLRLFEVTSGTAIRIGRRVTVVISTAFGDQARLAIQAPPDVPVHREEIYRQIQAAERLIVNLD